jgi:hypothetical protein
MTRLSLHIGVNRLDPAAYAGFAGWLRGCENDATGLASLALSNGYTCLGLLTDRATWSGCRRALDEAAGRLAPGDEFLLSFSGHGAQLPGAAGELIEALCFFDGPVREQQFRAAIRRMAPGVRVRVILDCCYAAGLERATALGPRRPRSLSAEAARRITPPGPQREAPAPAEGPNAALLCACGEAEVSYDGDIFGEWTGALLAACPAASPPASIELWYELASRIVAERQPLQHPRLRWLGRPGANWPAV